jgi:hypothetical protein
MGQRTPETRELVNSVEDDELLEAVLVCALQYGDACWRIERHRRRFGYDYRCSCLLDEVALKKSLLHLLAVEARSSREGPARGAAAG